MLHGRVLARGYYWEGDDPLRALTVSEEDAVVSLAREAAHRLAVSYVAVDIGQLESGEWLVIETGDAQFSGICQASLLGLWNALSRLPATSVQGTLKLPLWTTVLAAQSCSKSCR